MNKTLKRWMIIAMLTAMAIVLSIIDSFIPLMVPGVKLGLANVIILIMLYEFKPSEALLTDILRILLVGIIRGTLFTPTFLMSFSGGVFSFLVMFIFSRIKAFSPIGVSAIGAVFHSIGQIIIAMMVLDTKEVIVYLPYIGLLSLLTGILSGIITRIYLKRSITARFVKN
ncbi:MAG: Gx transporter family protein [Anaeroplasma sp.]